MKHECNLTSKGQVTVPKDIRDALGLVAGRPVRFEMDEDGNARIIKADDAGTWQQRKAIMRQRVAEVHARYEPIPDGEPMDGLSYQRWVRGDGPEV